MTELGTISKSRELRLGSKVALFLKAVAVTASGREIDRLDHGVRTLE